MADRTCTRCGARNRPDAEFCWQCYARFRAAAAGPWADASSGEGTLQAPRGSASTDGVMGALRPVALLAGVAAVGVAIWLGWGALFGKGFEFPPSIAGAPRLESPATETADEVLRLVGDLADVEMEAAFYGAAAPAYSIVTFELPEDVPLGALLTSMAEAQGPGAVPPPVAADGTVELSCRSFQVGTECSWADGERYVAVQGYGSTVQLLEPLARDLRAETA